MNDELRRRLCEEEGRRNQLYTDSEGYLTIGVGRLLDVRKGGRLRENEIDFLLDNDIGDVRSSLVARFPWMLALDPVRFGALVNMAFQLGVPGLAGFTGTLDAIKRNDWQTAHDHALASLWAKQTPGRAERIANELLTGKWQWRSTGAQ